MRPYDQHDHHDEHDRYEQQWQRPGHGPSGRPDDGPTGQSSRGVGQRRPSGGQGGGQGGGLSPNARKALLVGLAVALLVAVAATLVGVVAALQASSGRASRPGSGGSGGSGTPVASAGAGTPTATVTPSADASPTPANAPFICANPSGSTSTYVFINADHQLYRVNGCSTPVKLTHLDASSSILPVAFSPSGKLLMVSVGPAQQADSGGSPWRQELMNPQTGAVIETPFSEDESVSPSYPIDRFIAWADDSTFLEAEYLDNSGSIKVIRVNASTLASSAVTTFTWVAGAMSTIDTNTGIRLRGDYLYYGGYASASEGGAYLHRYALSTGTDTKLAPLGAATNGPCQVYDGPCYWTGPWDISRDGSTIVYHNPGPTQGPSDTYAPPETPLYAAHADGTSPVQITNPPGGADAHLSTPAIAPSGGRVVVLGGNLAIVPTDGSMTSTSLPANYQFAAWRTDGTALLSTQGPNYSAKFALYSLATKSVTNLANYTRNYVWAS